MTPHELIQFLTNQQGPCMRFCAYCPEDINTREVKECVESMFERIYSLEQTNEMILKDLIAIRNAYRLATGKDYSEERNENQNTAG